MLHFVREVSRSWKLVNFNLNNVQFLTISRLDAIIRRSFSRVSQEMVKTVKDENSWTPNNSCRHYNLQRNLSCDSTWTFLRFLAKKCAKILSKLEIQKFEKIQKTSRCFSFGHDSIVKIAAAERFHQNHKVRIICYSDFTWNQFWLISKGLNLLFLQFWRLWILSLLVYFHMGKCQTFSKFKIQIC